jgi:hypothetical protein
MVKVKTQKYVFADLSLSSTSVIAGFFDGLPRQLNVEGCGV